MEGPEFEDETEEDFECGHHQFLAEVIDNLVVASYNVEHRLKNMTDAEKLQMLMGMMAHMIYDGAQMLEVSRFILKDDEGHMIEVIPQMFQPKPKSELN